MENYDETENKPEEYEKKPKSWKNSKYEKPNSQNNKEPQPKEPSAEKEESKVYSTREFRRSNSGPGGPKKYPKPLATADSNPDQETGTGNEPKKSGKSYASKRKERQQQKKESAKNSDDGILDLPSE